MEATETRVSVLLCNPTKVWFRNNGWLTCKPHFYAVNIGICPFITLGFRLSAMEAHESGDDEDWGRIRVMTECKRDPVVWTPELDGIIRQGYARGWRGAQEAINRVHQIR